MLNIYVNLIVQFDKVFTHNRQGSYQTKHRYAEAFKRFLLFLAGEYRLERIANIAPKHLYAYVDHLKERQLSPAYIKTELSAIRFYHDQIPRAKHRLPENDSLNLQRREFGKVDRTWSGGEFNRFLARATTMGREDYAAILCLARYAALRLHECFRIDTQMARRALETGELTIKGKGGLVREVPINLTIRFVLEKALVGIPRGHKLFVEPGDKTHLAMQRLEEFIRANRDDLRDSDSTRPLTFHGLRHTCAAEWYEEFLDEVMTEYQARKSVAKSCSATTAMTSPRCISPRCARRGEHMPMYPMNSGLAAAHMHLACEVSTMPKTKMNIRITHRFQTQNHAARRAAFTHRLARWVNGIERAKYTRES